MLSRASLLFAVLSVLAVWSGVGYAYAGLMAGVMLALVVLDYVSNFSKSDGEP